MVPTHLHNLYCYVKPEEVDLMIIGFLDHENIGIDNFCSV